MVDAVSASERVIVISVAEGVMVMPLLKGVSVPIPSKLPFVDAHNRKLENFPVVVSDKWMITLSNVTGPLASRANPTNARFVDPLFKGVPVGASPPLIALTSTSASVVALAVGKPAEVK